MAWIVDSLRGALESVTNRIGLTSSAAPSIFTHQLALAAYMSSGMLRKVITIPADDRVREWRDWQADKDAIALIEAEEKRLGLQLKVQEAEVLRGIGGGALLLITAGDHSTELNPDQIAEGDIVAINVVSRWQLRGIDWVRDLASPDYGFPAMWETKDQGNATRIHPSRVICFRGQAVPAGGVIGDEERFWGDSRLLRVHREVERADQTQSWFAALVRKAKLLRIGIPDLDSMDADRIGKRVALIAEGEGIMNATVFRSSGGKDDTGETITDYQITWAGIPDVMDAFDQRVAAVADIPFTRLMGRSPAGMNATGDHDTDNWNKMVAAGQKLETEPCLSKLDPFLLRSAGVADPEDVTWKWAPLWTPTEKEEADTFNATMDAVVKLQNTGTIPEEAFSKGVQNLMTEREYIPGLDQALAAVPKAERFPVPPEPTDEELAGDPSALPAREGKQGRPFGDAKRRRHSGERGKRAHYSEAEHPRGPGGRWIAKGVGRFDKDATYGAPANASEIQAQAGVSTAHLMRTARADDLNHASRYSKSGRTPPSQAVLRTYAKHAATAHTIRAQGQRGHGSGLRVRSEIAIGRRRYTLVERVGERSGTLSFVTMWENK